MTQRRYIYGSFRKKIWEKFNRVCQNCGCVTKLFRNQLTFSGKEKLCAIDHIIPFSKGGECSEENFQLLCETCNSQKGARA